MWMRGGTSKGGYFLKQDLPADEQDRADFLLSVMGSPNERQIDGMGGADPLTSKVGVINKSQRPGVDVDYLFLQVAVDKPVVTDAQNCGNILAGVGPFAIERGLVTPSGDETRVSIYMENTGQIAIATVETPSDAEESRRVNYKGDARIDGVPGTSAPVPLEFKDTAGSSCGALLPTGNVSDEIDGVEVTMIDNGMPCVVMLASDMGISGDESREELEANTELRTKLEAIRLKCGPLMNLGDVTDKTVPKMTMVSPPKSGGAVSTRTFIPHRCHASIGVLGAVSVATACLLKGGPANKVAFIAEGDTKNMPIEHPIGETTIVVHMKDGEVDTAAILRTANKLMDGLVFA
ncbi:MAG: 4-oxalomesaconate tautomerase [Rhizobiaceae bacterium]|nr:4-oxalomesaconate tautomerase [Rhizobiaceae bacterium]